MPATAGAPTSPRAAGPRRCGPVRSNRTWPSAPPPRSGRRWPASTCCRGRRAAGWSWRSTRCPAGAPWRRRPASTWPPPSSASSTSSAGGDRMLSAGLSAYLACAWEATARKPGNVHRFRDFDDLTYLDFLTAGAAVAPVLDRAAGRPVGQTILDAVRATRQVAKTNVNLGIVLLLAPLAAVPDGEDLRADVDKVLDALDVDDSRMVFEAIRLAAPSGLGDAP